MMPLNPSFHWGYLELGQAWMQCQAYDQAVAAFQRVYELAPETPWLAKKTGRCLTGTGVSGYGASRHLVSAGDRGASPRLG